MSSIEEKKYIIDANLNETEEKISVELEKRIAHIVEKLKLAGEYNSDEAKAGFALAFDKQNGESFCI